ncbi:serine hydrolase-like protein [Aricia agestis]|uniref:serine hydrolase-like protein n=1 Tax=Aricia agestis TaxID=91739 RepID=UPI001C2017C8|nr:serine hydrolase-like protein [Aricia agestis]
MVTRFNFQGVSWGSSRDPGVLLVHGYMDSAATFIPLVRLLPREHYYVAIDMPGHGSSDPFPVGPVVSHAHQLEAARRVVEHLGWTSFIFVSHSVGFIIGVLYNVVYPGRVTRMVHLDPVPPLTAYCYHHYHLTVWFAFTHEEYYENQWDLQRNKTFCYEDAVNSVMRKRKVNREQAEVLLSRGLVNAGEAMYR